MTDYEKELGHEPLSAREGVLIMRDVARLVCSGEHTFVQATSPVARAKIRESLELNYERLGAYYVECPFK